METDDDHVTMRESFSLVQNKLFIDYPNIIPTCSRKTRLNSLGPPSRCIWVECAMINNSAAQLQWAFQPIKLEWWLQRTMSCLGSMFSFQPNKLRLILKFMSWYIIQHIFVPACSVGRKSWFSRKLWLSNSKFGISGSFWPILSVPKIMFLVPENEKRKQFQSILPKRT